MRLFDFVQKQNRVRLLIDGIGHQPTLVEPHVTGRRADKPRNAVAFHVFRHVETNKIHAKRHRQLLCNLGFADPGGAREQVAADGLFGLAQARA